ncbi:hypothetical protein MIND_01160900 [Mycena indigotica]|uniref:Phytase A n=1 Tax=Mycena indigotica TaxID=2126181 RepID=A0A8H6S799_9AGAR|nr:uncharacterized protein MIND_01160900 [Mycena indigotica]KAF7292630.1 hypothetical protein MIND_01160900 [Mycena indigotica]
MLLVMLGQLFPASLLLLSSAKTNSVTTPSTISKSWGAYTPYFAVGAYEPPPKQCVIEQAHILERHGARFPTSGSGASIKEAIEKLQKPATYNDPRMKFLKNFTYSLGVADLVPFGALQCVLYYSFDHPTVMVIGLDYRGRSSTIATENFSALTTYPLYEPRVDSEWWTVRRIGPLVRRLSGFPVLMKSLMKHAGFSAASQDIYKPTLNVVLSEAGNDTLDDNGCPNAGSSDTQTAAWLSIFAPSITKRLNAGAPGANLVDSDTYALIAMCAFHTVATAQGSNLTLSPFCDLFDKGDFMDFEYAMDLDKYYGTGYGAFLGRVQGVGYINELISRLTSTPVNDSTQTNTTLTSNPETFPLNRTIYADFSHDNQIIAIFTAMGLFRQQKALDPTSRTAESGRTWLASHLVPFSARMTVERLLCGPKEHKTKSVRIFVNDELQPLEFCAGSNADKQMTRAGICKLERFLESQSYARNGGEGEWDECFT